MLRSAIGHPIFDEWNSTASSRRAASYLEIGRVTAKDNSRGPRGDSLTSCLTLSWTDFGAQASSSPQSLTAIVKHHQLHHHSRLDSRKRARKRSCKRFTALGPILHRTLRRSFHAPCLNIYFFSCTSGSTPNPRETDCKATLHQYRLRFLPQTELFSPRT